MKRLIKYGAIISLSLCFAACVTIPKKAPNLARGDYSYVKQYISWLIKNEMKKNQVTGLSIALVDDQRVVWAEGFGFADAANNISAMPETVYRAASISKLLTATGAMQLHEQGKLDIDKSIQTYFPEFKIKSRFSGASPITARNLMTHHSGLPSDVLKGMFSTKAVAQIDFTRDLIETFVAQSPNTVHAYSNLGVALLGATLAKVSGQDFSSYMATSLLRPLGMKQSHFAPRLDQSVNASKQYDHGKEIAEIYARDVPGAGLNTSVLDLSRFVSMVFADGRAGEQQVVKPETIKEMLRSQNQQVSLDFDVPNGLGWFLWQLNNVNGAGLVAGHDGDAIYHISQLLTLPEHKLGVIVMSNSAHTHGVTSRVAQEAMYLALEAKSGISRTPIKMSLPAEVKISAEELQGHVGRYMTNYGLIKVTKESDKLFAHAWGKKLRLVPRADGQLYLQYKWLGLFSMSLGGLENIGISSQIISGHEVWKGQVRGRTFRIGEKIAPVSTPQKWLDCLGEYELVDTVSDVMHKDVKNISLHNDDGLLVLNIDGWYGVGNMSLGLKPLSDTEAIIYGLGRGLGETISVINVGGEELLEYAGYRIKRRQK
jgi:CubicO group peptidase (beta-lactamase class C family)